MYLQTDWKHLKYCWQITLILLNIETTTHYLLHCSNDLMKEWNSWPTFKMLKKIFLIEIILTLKILLFGDSSFNCAKTRILNSTIKYIFDTKIFDVSLKNLWKLQKFEWSIYWTVSSMNRGDLILIRLILVSLYIDFHFV